MVPGEIRSSPQVRFPSPRQSSALRIGGLRLPAGIRPKVQAKPITAVLEFVLPGSDRRNRAARKFDGMCGTREPSNKGRLIGQKRPLKPKELWKIRARLQLDGRERDLAMFTRADDSKFRAAISFDSKSTT